MATIDDIYGRKPHSAVMLDPPQVIPMKDKEGENSKPKQQKPMLNTAMPEEGLPTTGQQQPQPSQPKPMAVHPKMNLDAAIPEEGSQTDASRPQTPNTKKEEGEGNKPKPVQAEKVVTPSMLGEGLQNPIMSKEVRTSARAETAPDTSGWKDYDSITKGLNDHFDDEMRRNAPLSAEQEERQRKRKKRDERIAAIGDGISALANLYFTSQDAPNAYDPKNSLSEKARERWERIEKEREGKRQAYYNAAMGKYKIAKDKADADALAGYRADQLALKKKAADDAAKKDAAKQAADDKEKEWQHQFKEGEADRNQKNKDADRTQKQQQMGETKRHNRVMEGIAAKNAATAATRAANSNSGSGSGRGGKKTNYTIRLHDKNTYTYTPDKIGAISGLAPAMIQKARAAARRYSSMGDFENRQHFNNVAEKLEKAGSKDAIAAIVAANVGDFPSMDADIRKIIGVNSFDASIYQRTNDGGSKPPLDD